ncbi:MAG: hypothetical protein H6835_13065 [Planctomycetes bacterium]|nr:hypothetical protein [Planctomycetota bacterium]
MALPADTIAFYLSGLAHQFGNLLLTIQGNALGLGRIALERPKEAILTAATRGAETLELLRILLGHHAGGEATAGPGGRGSGAAEPLLRQLLELARIPLRERGWTTRLTASSGSPIAVSPAAFVRAAASGLRWLAEMVPEGSAGVIDVRLTQAGARECSLRLSFETAPGALPFPLPTAELVAALVAEAPRGVAVRPEPGANGIELRLASAGGGLTVLGVTEA